jgi:hypothetical protein
MTSSRASSREGTTRAKMAQNRYEIATMLESERDANLHQANSPIWSIRRRQAVDWRTRGARRWRKLRSEFVAEHARATGAREPSGIENRLLDTAADAALALEVLRARLTAGAKVDTDEMGRLAGSLRRSLLSLGLVTREGPVEPADVDQHRHELEEAGL